MDTPNHSTDASGSQPRDSSASQRGKRKRIGNFEVMELIGEGGMGRVFKARHVLLDKLVALKVLKPGLKQQGDALARFRKEAQALARVDHPNVVQVLDVGTTPKGSAYIAMDYVPGMDLKRWMKQRGALQSDALVFIARQLISGIAAAHQAGILHRDIKPDNVLVDAQATVKITDFGLAGDVRLSQRAMTQQKHATIAYAAPEVLHGKGANARSDVFSLAATLYHLSAGKLPFGGKNIPTVLAAQEAGAPRLRKLAPTLPRALEAAVMRALSLDPAKRPEDASALLEMAFPPVNAGRASAAATLAILGGALAFAAAGGITLSKPFESTQVTQEPSIGSPDSEHEREQAEAERERLAAKERELVELRRKQEEEERARSQRLREEKSEREWQTLSPVIGQLDPVERAVRRIELMQDYVKRYQGTESARLVSQRIEEESAALADLRASHLRSARTALVESSPAQAASLLQEIPEYLLEGESEATQAFAAAIKDLRAEIAQADADISSKALAESTAAFDSNRFFAALMVLRNALEACANPTPALQNQLNKLEAERIAGHQRAVDAAATARRALLQARATQALIFAEKLRELETSLQSGLSGASRKSTLERVAKACPPDLLPAWEAWLAEFQHITQAELWLKDVMEHHKHRLVEITPIDVARARAGKEHSAEVIGVDAESVRMSGGTSGSKEFKLIRLHPHTWRWFENNLPPTKATQESPPWESVLRICRLHQLSYDMDWVAERAGFADDQPEAELTRFADSAYLFLEATVALARISAEEVASMHELERDQPALTARFRQPLSALTNNINGRRGYAEITAGIPDALVSEAALYHDLMRGARVLEQFERLLMRLPNDPTVIAACVELAQQRGADQIGGESLSYWIAKGRELNPYDQSLWQAEEARKHSRE